MIPRMLATAVAWMAGIILLPLPLTSQEFTFQNIRWGESAVRVHTLLRGLGYDYSHIDSQGDLIFLNDDVRVSAMLAEDRLVGIAVTVSGMGAEMEELFDTLVARTSADHGLPNQADYGRQIRGVWETSWSVGETSLTLRLIIPPDTLASDISTLFANYGGPGYNAELSRRFAALSAEIEAERRRWAADRLASSRWEILYGTDSLAVSFDPRRSSRSGQVVMAWVRWDTRSPISSGRGYRYDASITRTEIRCPTLRNREYERVDYLGAQNVHSFPSEPTAWEEAIPGSLGEEVFGRLCGRVR
jgi:hypothetical protein